MGVIQKGSSISTIFLVLGILLGFITSGILLPNYFTIEQNGIITVITSYYLIYSQIVLLGLHTTVIRFFPHFKNDSNRNNDFLSIMSLILLTSITIFSIFFFSSLYLYPNFLKGSPQFKQYYWLAFPLTIFTVYFYLFDAYFSARLRGAIGFFLKDVLQRVLIIVVMLGFIVWQFDFDRFIFLYCGAISIPTIYFLVILIKDKQFSSSIRSTNLYKENWKYMAKVSGYSLLLGLSWVGLTNLDAIMIERILGIKDAGIYGRNMFFGVLVAIPYRAIHKISSGVISNAFKENDIENIKAVYYKSSLNQTILGLFIFCGIWLNIENVYHIIPEKYESGKFVILFIGLGNLFSMIGGVNTAVISFSPYYRWNTIFVGILLVLVVITNLIFIPTWKITGASCATALSLLLYNLMMYILLLVKFKFQPIHLNHFVALIFAAVTLTMIRLIPPIHSSYILDIIVRSGLFTLVFGSLVYLSKLSPDINSLINQLLSKVIKK